MAKDRIKPCIHYVCANNSCQKGYQNVTHAKTCQTCGNYCPRKLGNEVKESVKTRKEKNAKKDLTRQLKEYR